MKAQANSINQLPFHEKTISLGAAGDIKFNKDGSINFSCFVCQFYRSE